MAGLELEYRIGHYGTSRQGSAALELEPPASELDREPFLYFDRARFEEGWMAFIRKRVTGPTPTSFTYTLLEAYRVASMPRQRILANLGRSPTLEERIVMLCRLPQASRTCSRRSRNRGLCGQRLGQRAPGP
jgi:hypothetical protein